MDYYGEDAYEKWVTKYKPITNTFSTCNGGHDSQEFETFGQELEFVIKANAEAPKKVWTLLEADGSSWIAAGYHIVNRNAFFLCEVEWEDETDQYEDWNDDWFDDDVTD